MKTVAAGKNPFGDMGAMFEQVKKAQQAGEPSIFCLSRAQIVQIEAVKVQKELAEFNLWRSERLTDGPGCAFLCRTEFDGYDPDELVKVVLTGNQEPRSTEITEEAMEKGAERSGVYSSRTLRELHQCSEAALHQQASSVSSLNMFCLSPEHVPNMWDA
eukprot:1192873-Prorocentrum_minimum.AAC.3